MASKFKATATKKKPSLLKPVSDTERNGPAYSAPAPYLSQYTNQLNSLQDAVLNYGGFNYDFNTDPKYQAYAKEYGRLGNLARQNTLGDAVVNTGGYASSYATTAANEAQNDYNRQLTAMIPQLEETAYGRWLDQYNMNLSNYGLVKDADDTAYGKYRDTVGDKQWQYGMDWDKYTYNKSYDYQKQRDSVSDTQWKKQFNWQKTTDNRNYKLQKRSLK